MRTFIALMLAVALSTPALAKLKIKANNSQLVADTQQTMSTAKKTHSMGSVRDSRLPKFGK
jgi:hypothetical protein